MLARKRVLTASASSSATLRSRRAASAFCESVMSSTVSRPLPSGSGTPANSSVRPSASATRPPFCLRSSVAARTTSPIAFDCAGLWRAGRRSLPSSASICGCASRNSLIQPPIAGETAIPQLQPAVGRKHGERFEQAVESRSAGAQQRIARRRQRKLFGAVFGDHHQPAVRHRLGDDPQMRAVGKRPGFLLGSSG